MVLAGDQPVQMRAPQFSWAVRTQLEQLLGGADAVDTGGYNVITTLDWTAQQTAEKYLTAAAVVPNLKSTAANALMSQLKIGPADRPWVQALRGKDIHNGAMVALDYRSGDVLAYVGSAGYYRSDPREPEVRTAGRCGQRPSPAGVGVQADRLFDGLPGNVLRRVA